MSHPSAERPCPSWETLVAWLKGELDGPLTRLIGSHVPDCSGCRKRLALLNVVGDHIEPGNYAEPGAHAEPSN